MAFLRALPSPLNINCSSPVKVAMPLYGGCDRPRRPGSDNLNHTFRNFNPTGHGGTAVSLVFLSTSDRKTSSVRCFSALSPDLKTTLDKVITSHKVVLFMKGTKEFPQCGFSNTVVQILKSLNVPFETINILENDILRQGLKEYSSWPTFPQLYIDGEFFGGCDITVGNVILFRELMKEKWNFQNEIENIITTTI